MRRRTGSKGIMDGGNSLLNSDIEGNNNMGGGLPTEGDQVQQQDQQGNQKLIPRSI